VLEGRISDFEFRHGVGFGRITPVTEAQARMIAAE